MSAQSIAPVYNLNTKRNIIFIVKLETQEALN